MPEKRVFAVASHPDDIEFMMSGTLMLLKNAGYELHYMNVANGSCGTASIEKDKIIKMRREEAMEAAEYIGAVFHDSLVNDIEVFYEKLLLERLGAIMREVNPEIVLTHYPYDYMEDHSNTCRLAVTAAFCRSMVNFPVDPYTAPVSGELTLYHSIPHALKDPLKRKVDADFYVDVSSVLEKKKEMLAFHRSQKEWLDKSQGMDSYIHSMIGIVSELGKDSGKFEFAEGWVKHLYLGFCDESADPLETALKDYIH